MINKLPELLNTVLQKVGNNPARTKLMKKLNNIMREMTTIKPNNQQWSPSQIQKILSLRKK